MHVGSVAGHSRHSVHGHAWSTVSIATPTRFQWEKGKQELTFSKQTCNSKY